GRERGDRRVRRRVGGRDQTDGEPHPERLERDAGRPSEERDSLREADDHDRVGSLGRQPPGRHANHGVRGDLAGAGDRRPLPRATAAGRAVGPRRDRRLAAARAALDGQPAGPHALEELGERERAAGAVGRRGGRRRAHRASRPKRLTSTVAVLPPSVWVSPTRAPATWRGPASPRSCVAISAICAAPVAPIGWPLALSPPEVFTGIRPPRLVSPFSAAGPPVPGSKSPRPSVATISAIVKQSWSST